MKSRYDGRYIKMERGDNWNAIRNLKCLCGHALKDHYSKKLPEQENWIEVGACNVSDHCQQFRLNRIQAGNYDYAQA